MKPFSTMDSAFTIVGIVYGIIVFLSAFINNKFLYNFRIDLFFTRNPTPLTQRINILFGILILGSSIYSYLSHFK